MKARCAGVALLGLLGTLAGCGGGSVAAPPAGPPTSELRIGMEDYRFQLSAAAVLPGRVTVVTTNVGSTAHDVLLTQDGRAIGHSDLLSPGARQTLDVDVASSAPVQLTCTVAGHAAMGMRASVTVAAAPSPAAP